MNRGLRSFAIAVVLVALGGNGCRSSPGPEMLFSEAEGLRIKYENEASQTAIRKYREAIAAWDRQGQKADAARAWQRLGATYWQVGALNDSLRAYQAALSLVEGTSNRLLESGIRSDVGIAQSYAAGTAVV